jgi:uncharacterized cupredoxin-like copper-binding protein
VVNNKSILIPALILGHIISQTSIAHDGMSEEEFISQAQIGHFGNPDLDLVDEVRAELKHIHWSKIEPTVLTLDEYIYDPEVLEFVIGKPYRLLIRNVGNKIHDLTGHDLFSTMAIYQIRTEFGRISTPHIDSIVVSPQKEVEILMTPMEAGKFPMVCTYSGHHDDGMEGDVIVRAK